MSKPSARMFEKIVLVLSLAVLFQGCTKKREYGPPTENVYRMAIGGKFVSLDPHVVTDAYSIQAQSLNYESLYEYEFLKRPLELKPALAEAMPKVSLDGLTWIFPLKKGVYYQDDPCFQSNQGKGREVVAQDYIDSFKRIANSKLGSPVYSVFEPLVKGLKEFKEGKSNQIEGVKALSPYTLQIQIIKKSPRFAYNFVNVTTAPLPGECIQFYGEKLAEHTVGTGPYVITKYSRDRVIAVKNPKFRKDTYPSEGSEQDKAQGLLVDAGKQVPFIDRIELEVVEEDQPRWLKFMSGEFSQSGVPKDSADQAFENGQLSPTLKERGVKFFRQTSNDITLWHFNMRDPVWGKHRELRQALAYARDIPIMIERIYSGFAVPAQSIILPGMYGYQPDYRSPYATRNIEKAKQLLAQAGYPEGRGLPPVVYPNSASTTGRQLAELTERQFKEIGVQLQFEPVSWPDLMKRAKEGKFTVLGMGSVGTDPDPDGFLIEFHSRSIPPNGQNYTHYQNPEYDQLVDHIALLENGPQRLALIRKAAEIIERDIPVLPMTHRMLNQLYQPWVGNTTAAEEMQKVPWLKYRRIQTAAQSK